ncbi:MAG: hypothetical protein BWY94_01969 [Actinobacteria bacterium ADurb.BinA094]|nr:MAG: hypothetical protein BWY94_01969 [Actinobacteria bacterium ADurb.BinA094]
MLAPRSTMLEPALVSRISGTSITSTPFSCSTVMGVVNLPTSVSSSRSGSSYSRSASCRTISARYPAASKRGSARPKRTSPAARRRYQVCGVSSSARGLLGDTARTTRLVAKEQYQLAHGRPVAGSSRSYMRGGMSCSSALTTTSTRSFSSVTWRSTWMLPCDSVTTSTPGFCSSNAVASLSKGTIRLPAYISLT